VVVFLNGAFGVGKTTVARALCARVPRSAIFDPEVAGWVLRRLPRWVALAGRGTDDYQDMPLWRRSAVWGVRAARLRAATVIVPMAFTNLDYLAAIRRRVGRFDPDVRHFCLTAPRDVVFARLGGRGADPASPRDQWAFRRAAECCEAHAGQAFAEHVPTAGRTVDAIAGDLAARLKPAAPGVR